MSSSVNFDCRYSNVNVSAIDAWMAYKLLKIKWRETGHLYGESPFFKFGIHVKERLSLPNCERNTSRMTSQIIFIYIKIVIKSSLII